MHFLLGYINKMSCGTWQLVEKWADSSAGQMVATMALHLV